MTGDAVRKLVEAELALAMAGSGPLERKLRGEDVDLGNPTLNAVVERTARRLAGIPDLVVPQVAEGHRQLDRLWSSRCPRVGLSAPTAIP
jgi:hypothetical protein